MAQKGQRKSGFPALRGSLARGAGKGGCSFPLAGKNQRATGAANPSQHHDCPRPLAAWPGGETSCCARLSASLRGRLGTPLGFMLVVRWRPGGTGESPSLRARWRACQGVGGVCGLTGQTRRSFAQRCMAGEAGAASVGLRRRSPPPAPKAEGASMGEAGRPQGSPARARPTQPPSPAGKVSRRKP